MSWKKNILKGNKMGTETKSWPTISAIKAKYNIPLSTSTFTGWCREKKINAIEDMTDHGMWRIDPTEIDKIKEMSNYYQKEFIINGIKYYSLSKTVVDKFGSNIPKEILNRKYQLLYRWVTKIPENKFKMLSVKCGKLKKHFIEEDGYICFLNMIPVTEASKLAKVSRRSIYDWIEKGYLKSYDFKGMDSLIWKEDLVNISNKRKEIISFNITKNKCSKLGINISLFSKDDIIKIEFKKNFDGGEIIDILFDKHVLKIQENAFYSWFNDTAYYDDIMVRNSGQINLVTSAFFERLNKCDRVGGIIWNKCY